MQVIVHQEMKHRKLSRIRSRGVSSGPPDTERFKIIEEQAGWGGKKKWGGEFLITSVLNSRYCDG